MPGRQAGVSNVLVGAVIALVVMLVAVGGAAVAKVGPFASKSPSGSSALTKPADPNRLSSMRSSAPRSSRTPATTPQAPPRRPDRPPAPVIDFQSQPSSGGKKFETVQNGGTKTFCAIPEGAPAQHFPQPQPTTAEQTDPFNFLKTKGSNWRYLDDADVSSHKAWHVMGDVTQDVGVNSPLQYKLNTAEAWIDSTTGEIVKLSTHTISTQAGVTYDNTGTDTNFVYDHGATTTACP